MSTAALEASPSHNSCGGGLALAAAQEAAEVAQQRGAGPGNPVIAPTRRDCKFTLAYDDCESVGDDDDNDGDDSYKKL